MNITTETKDGVKIVAIKGDLVIGELAAAQSDLVAAIQDVRTATFDLGDVTTCDAAGFQFLLMAFASLKRRNTPFGVWLASPAVSNAAIRCGCTCKQLCPEDTERSGHV